MGKTISELIEKTSASNSDVLLIEDGTSTNKITKANLLKEVTQELSYNNGSSEGTYITVTGSKEGSITNLEILGNTAQSSTNLADIQSVGTKQEDGRYKMSILSCGKNLFDGKYEKDKYINSQGIVATGTDWCATYFIKVKPSTKYIQNFPINNSIATYVCFYDINKNFISGLNLDLAYTTPANCYYIRTSWKYSTHGFNFQLEEGTVSTTYEPYQGNKTSILLPCQLEKVGTVSDRLFRREDGVWCIEKNIGEVVLNGSENWTYNRTINGFYQMYILNYARTKYLISSFTTMSVTEWVDGNKEGITLDNAFALCLSLGSDKAIDITSAKKYLANNNIKLYYVKITPQIIELPLDVQIQLNSFNGVTNIFTEDTVIEPTIKATVPKSLGASVNSLVNKTDILSDRVEAVEKLKEGSELEVFTDKGYVVCENTNNGQIEELKVEGNTLVNLYTNKTKTYSTNYIYSSSEAFSVNKLKPSTVYTMIIHDTSGRVNATRFTTGATDFDLYPTTIGTKPIKFTTPSILDSAKKVLVYAYPTSSNLFVSGDEEKIKYVLLEGDHSQNPPSYFEGLKSVGDGVDKIEVLSNNNDKVIYEVGTLDTSTGSTVASSTRLRSSNYLKTRDNTTQLYKTAFTSAEYVYIGYDENFSFVEYSGSNWITKNFTFVKPVKYYKFVARGTGGTNLTSSSLSLFDNVIDLAIQNKKQILFLNKSGAYEKPTLRSTGTVSDSIEKHSDGKYYFHKRCGEVVFNGGSSESWELESPTTTTNTIAIKGTVTGMIATQDGNKNNIVCDKFPTSTSLNTWNLDVEGCSYATTSSTIGRIRFRISKTKATDLSSAKTWLTSNPVTVVYQLATEEVYECMNLDLDSYEGETSVIFNGGAISPKLSFKIASHIANTIQVLKDRISYLEGKVMDMFKAVLRGDVMSLAYELYPEDFEEEIIEETETLEN